jgi:endonuclease G
MTVPIYRKTSPFRRYFGGCITVLVVLTLIGYVIFRIVRPFVHDSRSRPTETRVPRMPTPADSAAGGIFLKLGNPSGASGDINQPNNFLLVSQASALSYNRDRGEPNWVAWRLTPADLGDIQRENDFRPDDRLPAGWRRILPTDYTRSGYTRGHMCPAGDRTTSQELNSLTFLMTNIVPQTDDSNQGVWLTFEEYCRDLAEHGATLYIVAGAYGDLGRIRNRVTIPSSIWKVVVIIPRGEELGPGLSHNARVLAINTPNTDDVRYDDWRKYRTTVRAIEQATGYDLLSALPREEQDRVETVVGEF